VSALQEFSDAQLFFLAFALMSSPVFLYFYLRAAIEGTTQKLLRRPSSEGGIAIIDAEAPSSRHSTAKPAGPREAADLAPVPEDLDQRDEVFSLGAAPRTIAHDVIILPLRHKPLALPTSEAAFPAKAHYRVPGSHSFQIMLEVKGLLEPQELEREMTSSVADEASGPLIAEIGEGETVGLSLECLPGPENDRGDERAIDIDSTYQAFSLGSRPVTAIFLAHSKAVEIATEANMSLRITAGEAEIGTIDFEITVDPTIQITRTAV
jgi:hypothetical protein